MKLPVLLLLVASISAAQSQPASPDPSGTPGLVHLDPETAAALVVKKVPAVYPEKARSNGVQGDVVLRVVISELGDVKETTVVSGDPDLARAATESIQMWKYKPYTIDGKPTSVETQVRFDFHVKGPPPLAPAGGFHDGNYQNPFFRISYPLSTDWVRETNSVRKQVESTEGAQSSTQVLLAALHVPAKSDGFVADSSFVLVATPPPAQDDAKSYLVATAKLLEENKVAKQRGEIVPLTIAGLTAYRANFRPLKGDAQYQSIVCAVTKGYMLRWSFLAISESVLDETVGGVSKITSYDADPASPAVASAAPSPSPSTSPSTSPKDAPPVISTPTRMRVSSGVTVGLLLKKVEPRYPPDAKSAHIQGVVILHVIIDKEGNIMDMELFSGPIELVPPTVYAVRQWKYRPYLLKGQPIELDTTIEVRYSLGF